MKRSRNPLPVVSNRAAATLGLLLVLVAAPATHADTAGVRQWTPTTLAADLVAGGYLLLVQHAAERDDPRQGDCDGVLDDAAAQRAGEVADGLRERGIPVSVVRAAATCVAGETARLLGVGEAETDPRLAAVAPDETDAARIAALRQALEVAAPVDSNVLLVTYRANVERLLKTPLETLPASVHVLRRLDGRLTYLGVIAPGDWPRRAN